MGAAGPAARREEGEYSTYLTDEQRSRRAGSARFGDGRLCPRASRLADDRPEQQASERDGGRDVQGGGVTPAHGRRGVRVEEGQREAHVGEHVVDADRGPARRTRDALRDLDEA